MNAAKFENSPRLQRVLELLAARRKNNVHKGWVTTRQIVRLASVCAVNSIITELRINGCVIDCRKTNSAGQVRFLYRLRSAPKPYLALVGFSGELGG